VFRWPLFLIALSSCHVLSAAEAAKARLTETLALMRRVNAWQSAHLVMPSGDRNWERATWYTGVTEAWKATRDPSFLNQALKWGNEHQWQVGTEDDGANRLFCVETWLELYFLKRDRAMIEPAVRWLDTPAPNSPAGAKRWYLEDGRAYVDSLYGGAALAMLARATGDPKYLAILRAFFDDVTGELFDKEAGLYYRDQRYIGRKTRSGAKVFWARGNGWVFAGIPRILEYLPEGDPGRARYIELFRRMAAALVKRQGADGLWRASLEDPDELPNPETSGTAFFCFGLARGIREGWLDRAACLPHVRKAWDGLRQSVSPEGKVLWGQQVDAQPNPTARDSTHEYVTGAFLLAGSEMYRLFQEE
jgi:rhamnogalacturonyl hydrolase YesR